MIKLFLWIITKLNKSKNKPQDKDNSVFTNCEFQYIPNTCNSVIEQKNIFLGTKNQEKKICEQEKTINSNEKYNTFIEYCYANQQQGGLLPLRETIEAALSLKRTERLSFIDVGIRNNIFIKKKNNKVFFNPKFNIEDLNKIKLII